MDVETFTKAYNELDGSNLEVLKTVYHEDVVFEDPVHKVCGLPSLLTYFSEMFSNVSECRFDIGDVCQSGSLGYVTWTMTFIHPRINRGQAVCVDGTSHLKFLDGQVIYHRDYFDMGQMIYEHLPLLGSAIHFIKKRLAT
ncbi:nuclear transport factor 2 family protein [Vibrio salinus]|uniref:nuclear transport factor 2 family protein n=1 Tax=Vibrio salinus TaxID=2899784 RepID=UPI001E3DFE31|nr:nuclear transport factor 2 family protein [Vibrio salinus]MCE0496237.1 nuclear transport factor 2 family protein [Vibrio salinus]